MKPFVRLQSFIAMLCLLLIAGNSQAQSTPLYGDSIKILPLKAGTTGLQIRNTTANLTGAALVNTGNGNTAFRYVVDSVKIEDDSLKVFRGGIYTAYAISAATAAQGLQDVIAVNNVANLIYTGSSADPATPNFKVTTPDGNSFMQFGRYTDSDNDGWFRMHIAEGEFAGGDIIVNMNPEEGVNLSYGTTQFSLQHDRMALDHADLYLDNTHFVQAKEYKIVNQVGSTIDRLFTKNEQLALAFSTDKVLEFNIASTTIGKALNINDNGLATVDWASGYTNYDGRYYAIPTGTTGQYVLGDGSLQTSNVSTFANDAGYATAASFTAFTNKTGNISQWTNDAGYLTSSSGLTPTLANNKFWVGNGSNIATAVTPTGDVTFDIAGVFGIGAGKVTNAMLAGSIGYSKLNLTGAIVNADLAGSIGYSKLNLTGAIVNADLAGSIAYSKLNLTGAIVNADLAGSIANAKLQNSAVILGTTSVSLGATASTIAGMTSYNKVAITAPATGSTLTIIDGKTLTVNNTLAFSGTDASTLNIGAGGTLGSNAFNSTAYVTPSSTDVFTNKSGNNSQWTNDAGYITAASTNTLIHKSGQISQWTNDAGYLTSSTGLSPTLANGNFWVGNGSNIATAVTPTGDVTFDNAGVFTIGSLKVTSLMLAGSIGYSKLNLTGSIANGDLAGSIANAKLLNSSLTIGTTSISLGATASTIAGVTSYNKVAITAPATGSTLTIIDGKTATFNNTLAFSGTDASTLNIGAGGTLGSNAFTSTAYAPATSGTSILKGNGSGGFSNATAGTDYAVATSGTSILKANGTGGFSNATAGTDYTSPSSTETFTNKSISGTTNTLTNIPNSALQTGIDGSKVTTGIIPDAQYQYVKTTLGSSYTTANTCALSATQYISPTGAFTNFNGSENIRTTVCPVTGIVRDLYVVTGGAQPSSGSFTIVIRKNNSNQAVTLIIAANAAQGTFSDVSNSFSVTKGDLLSVQGTNAATAVSAPILAFGFAITNY